MHAHILTRQVDLNKREDSCNLSGFLPIHAVIASSNVPMYEFLTTELPRELRCDAQNATYIGRLEAGHEFACLTPLQLAASLGDRSLVRHILRKQCEVMWKWGPVTQVASVCTICTRYVHHQATRSPRIPRIALASLLSAARPCARRPRISGYIVCSGAVPQWMPFGHVHTHTHTYTRTYVHMQFALDLRGIDSTGQGSGDLMELIVRLGARDRTCEMLLDTFMNGNTGTRLRLI